MINKTDILRSMVANFEKTAEASDHCYSIVKEDLRQSKHSQARTVTSYYFKGGKAVFVEKQDSITNTLQPHSLFLHQKLDRSIGKEYTESLSNSLRCPLYFERNLVLWNVKSTRDLITLSQKDIKCRAIGILNSQGALAVVGSVPYFEEWVENMRDIGTSDLFKQREIYVASKRKMDEQLQTQKPIHI